MRAVVCLGQAENSKIRAWIAVQPVIRTRNFNLVALAATDTGGGTPDIFWASPGTVPIAPQKGSQMQIQSKDARKLGADWYLSLEMQRACLALNPGLHFARSDA